MKKIIIIKQDNLIECDHCDYVIPNEDPWNPGDGKEYINQPCPECGHNLLTERDFLMSKKIDDKIKWINKWFGWLSFLPWFKTPIDDEVATMKVHNGLKIDRKLK